MKKVLVIRFSSIGDIVLTTPVLRCIKNSFPEAEIHYITKASFSFLLQKNPNVDFIHTWEDFVKSPNLIANLGFDAVVDLHKNLRSSKVKKVVDARVYSFDKLNIKKWLYVNFKSNIMPDVHIIERYLFQLEELGISYDDKGLDYFYSKEVALPSDLNANEYFVLVMGAAHATKQIPNELFTRIIPKLGSSKLVLLGGKEEREKAEALQAKFPELVNYCGSLSLDESAKVVEHSKAVVTSDTGLMHIAAAFNKKIAVLWGNTTPELGMFPFECDDFKNFEVADLSCRPCSKIGKKKCPKGHFKCMINQNESAIADYLLA